MKTLPKVRDYMDVQVITVRPDTPMKEVVDLLLDRHVTGAPVVDGEGYLLGIITEKDCLKLLTEGVGGEIPPGATVADLMSRDVVSLPHDADVYYAAGMFLKHTFRRLPVVRGGQLVGAITRFDLLRVIQANRVWP